MYLPKINDYVIWKNKNLEGWVYFKCNSYVTIEILVRPKDEENLIHSPIHRNERLLVICYSDSYSELNFIQSRNEISSYLHSKKEKEKSSILPN